MSAPTRRSAGDILDTRADHWPEAVTPITQLMARVFRFSKLMLDVTLSESAAHGLTYTEFEVLITLRSAAPPHELIPTELYNGILISSGGLTKVLYGLESKNLITRGKGRTDQRSKPVRLTAKGRTLAERVMTDVMRADGALISKGLNDPEIERMTKLLSKILATLEPK